VFVYVPWLFVCLPTISLQCSWLSGKTDLLAVEWEQNCTHSLTLYSKLVSMPLKVECHMLSTNLCAFCVSIRITSNVHSC